MMDFTGDMPDLKRVPMSGSKEWRDHIGSLRVTSGSAINTGGIYVPDNSYSRLKPYPDPIDDGVCVYERPDFEGRFQCWASGTEISDLGFGNWRDKISSVGFSSSSGKYRIVDRTELLDLINSQFVNSHPRDKRRSARLLG